ncbi:MAG: FKBP-type peptidyl-prolyl cis-trans isomerase [Lewinellaceae bacterium]|nr:FKBP-type peptidyl-prolyl cis-trans isomerase [Lewinellaceae bacterium]
MWSCGKEEDQFATDQEKIEKYLLENNLTAQVDPSGMHYIITTPGTGDNPSPNARVEVRYKGYLLDGTVFDQTGPGKTANFSLTGLIPGWRIAIPLLKKGGKGTFFLPSELGYGRTGSGIIPPNSVIVFDIELIAFSN